MGLSDRLETTQREGDQGDEHERPDGEQPAVVEGSNRRGSGGVAQDHDQHRDAQHPAQLARARHDGRCGGITTAGNGGERGAPQQRQCRADPDTAEHLPREPLRPERRKQAHLLVVPEVGARPHQGAGHHEDAVAVTIGQRSQSCCDDCGHQRAGHQCETGPQHAVPPDVLQPQDVGQQIGVEPQTGEHGRSCGDAEGRDLHQRRVQEW